MPTTRIGLRIEELDCAEEVIQLEDQLRGGTGIDRLSFDVVNRRMIVSFDAEKTSVDEIIEQVSRTGMHASREDQPGDSVGPRRFAHARLLLTIAAGLAIAIGFATHVVRSGELLAPFDVELVENRQGTPVVSRLFYASSICLGLWFVVPKAWLAVRRLRADMNLLMCVAVAGAIGLGQWLEARSSLSCFKYLCCLNIGAWSAPDARSDRCWI